MEKKPNDIPKPNKRNTISLKIAKKWAKRWRKEEGTYNSHHDCRAFNIPKIDLQEVLAEDGVASVRAYLGIEVYVDPDTGENVSEEKLMIVGVNKNGKDMIKTVKGADGALISDPDGDEDIYDFTRPCPSLCDPDSPLNG
jgi:hypothetical protein